MRWRMLWRTGRSRKQLWTLRIQNHFHVTIPCSRAQMTSSLRHITGPHSCRRDSRWRKCASKVYEKSWSLTHLTLLRCEKFIQTDVILPQLSANSNIWTNVNCKFLQKKKKGTWTRTENNKKLLVASLTNIRSCRFQCSTCCAYCLSSNRDLVLRCHHRHELRGVGVACHGGGTSLGGGWLGPYLVDNWQGVASMWGGGKLKVSLVAKPL